MVDNATLKRNARAQLGGNIFAKNWLMLLLAIFIIGAIEGVLATTLIGLILIIGPLSYGLSRMTTQTVMGKDVDLGDLFVGFTENFTQSLLLGLLTYLFTFLWSLLLFVPGIIKSYAYSMAFYIQQADKSKDWKTCLYESEYLMKGKKMDLFLLDLSFIGWYLLGMLCFGIGMFFVRPYHEMARANFYLANIA